MSLRTHTRRMHRESDGDRGGKKCSDLPVLLTRAQRMGPRPAAEGKPRAVSGGWREVGFRDVSRTCGTRVRVCDPIAARACSTRGGWPPTRDPPAGTTAPRQGLSRQHVRHRAKHAQITVIWCQLQPTLSGRPCRAAVRGARGACDQPEWDEHFRQRRRVTSAQCLRAHP